MRRRVLLSLIAFSLFSLLGPLIRVTFHSVPIAGHFDIVVEDVVLYVWPAFILGISPLVSWSTLVLCNVVTFAALGLSVGLLVSRPWIAGVLYLMTCVSIALLEAWGFKLTFDLSSAYGLAIAFLLYAIPFGVVGQTAKSGIAVSRATTG